MTVERTDEYILSLYADRKGLTQSQYVGETELRRYGSIVDDNVARLLQLLLRLIHARRLLEIGTSIGFSTAAMAQVIKEFDGNITTIEFDEKAADQALASFQRLGLSDFIEVLIGDARVLVPQLQGEFDFIFLDVDKGLYPRLFSDCVRLLRPGGLLVADDTLFPAVGLDGRWEHLIAPIEEFNHLVAKSQELESTILPVGDGITVAMRRSAVVAGHAVDGV